MGAASAVIEAAHRPALAGVAENRPRQEQLIERQPAMKNIPTEQAELPLQIERRENLPADHACREAGGIFVHGRDHEVGDLFAMLVPGLAVRQLWRDMLAEQARDKLGVWG